MTAHRCDLCGQFYDSYGEKNSAKDFNGVMVLNLDPQRKYWTHDPIELCPKCRDKVRDMLTPCDERKERAT